MEALTSVIEDVEDTDEDGAEGFVVNLNAYLRPGGLVARDPR